MRPIRIGAGLIPGWDGTVVRDRTGDQMRHVIPWAISVLFATLMGVAIGVAICRVAGQ